MALKIAKSGPAVVAVAVGLLLSACSGSDGGAEATSSSTKPASVTTAAVPQADSGGIGGDDTDWKTVEPASVDLDAGVLDDLADTARDNESTCLLVARHGRIAGEWYFNGGARDKAQEVFSATKSFASVIVGIAQDEGDLDIDDSASKYIGEWKGTPAERVTVEDILSNDSGRAWSVGQDYSALLRQRDKTQFAIDVPQEHEPGEVWAYNNTAIQTLDRIVQEATGTPTGEFGAEHLLDPIGMNHSRFSTDAAGNTLTFMGLRSTCRDMARFGQLLLRHGKWNGRQVVSKAYLAEATKTSQDLNDGYGYLIWLNRKGTLASATSPVDAKVKAEQSDAQMAPGAPQDMFWALGLGGQVVQVDPGSDTVVVRLGSASLNPTFGVTDTAKVVTEALKD
ncbi:MAG: beta-lactamase family protein [Acidimicrobiales bacterium]|nr:beta-lactamase family protein [Acidimicrobiales bacterium]